MDLRRRAERSLQSQLGLPAAEVQLSGHFTALNSLALKTWSLGYSGSSGVQGAAGLYAWILGCRHCSRSPLQHAAAG